MQQAAHEPEIAVAAEQVAGDPGRRHVVIFGDLFARQVGPDIRESGSGRAAAVPAPEGRPRITLRIRLPDRTVAADVAAKSVRKAQAAIRAAGADNIALVLQWHLTTTDAIAEAGLSAQTKAARRTPQ